MGFFDFLKGAGDGDSPAKKTRLKDFRVFFEHELKISRQRKLATAKSELRDIRHTLNELIAEVDGIDQSECPDDVHKKLGKIIRTNKPKYCIVMKRTLDELKSSAENVEDVAELDKALSAGLDQIAKTSVGEGRYLTAAYQDEMRRIHSQSKKLLSLREKITGGAADDEWDKKIRDTHKQYLNYLEESEKSDNLSKSLDELVTNHLIEGNKLKEDMRLLEDVEESLENPSVKALSCEIESAKKQLISTDDCVRTLFSKLGRALRKYGRYSPLDEKLCNALENDSVNTFLSEDPIKFDSFMVSFIKAVEDDAISLNDGGKTLAKALDARRELTPQLRSSREKLASLICELEDKLEEVKEFKIRIELSERVRVRKNSIKSLEQDIAKTGDKSERQQSEVKRIKKQLIQELAEAGVEVTG